MCSRDRALRAAISSWLLVMLAMTSPVAAQDEPVTDESAPEETAARDTAAQDTAAQDTAAPDAPAPDDAAQDTTAQDTTTQDTTAQDTTAQDTTAQDTTAQDTTAQDTTAQDTTAQDTAASSERVPVSEGPIRVIEDRPLPGRLEVDTIVDTFWGFHIQGRGAIAVHDLVDITVHAKLFTNPRLSRTGNDLWVETGAGARLRLDEELGIPAARLWVGLDVGLTHGSYLSDGSQGVPFDGIALRAYGDFRLPLVERVIGVEALAQLTFYTALREESGEAKSAVHTLGRAGVYLFDIVGLGFYGEHFYRYVRSQGDRNETPAAWLGGYAEARFDFGLVVGVAAGVDLTPDVASDDGEFYRAWLGWRH